MKSTYLLFALSLVLSAALSAPMNTDEQRNWCRIHKDKLYSRFRLYMKITRTTVTPPTGMCMLDIENSNMDLDETDEVTNVTSTISFRDSTATFEASGVNGSITLMGDEVHIPMSYIGVSFDPSSAYVFVNVSSWTPWEKSTTDLAANDFEGLKNIINHQILAINLGCDHQYPAPKPTPKPEKISTPSTTPGPTLLETPEPPTTVPPVDTSSDRKKNPDPVDFSLLVDTRCIKNVDVYFELKDACLAYKSQSPFKLVGQHGTGQQVRQDMKSLGTSYRTCKLKTSSTADNDMESAKDEE
ncbi:putative chemokine-binding protein [Bovine papular stomatitis virus]|uniref:Putative chemokine-binding protein n=1 Tax=Bovine papular stomatitis virus TaxID=129727 RepID=A0A0E3XB22_9POXV|nr:putative chemokine-binding protein [Bovine papular stomatitis virus]